MPLIIHATKLTIMNTAPAYCIGVRTNPQTGTYYTQLNKLSALDINEIESTEVTYGKYHLLKFDTKTEYDSTIKTLKETCCKFL